MRERCGKWMKIAQAHCDRSAGHKDRCRRNAIRRARERSRYKSDVQYAEMKKAQSREWYAVNNEKANGRHRQWYSNNPIYRDRRAIVLRRQYLQQAIERDNI